MRYGAGAAVRGGEDRWGSVVRSRRVLVCLTGRVSTHVVQLRGDRVITTASTPISPARARIPLPYVPPAPMIATSAGLAP